MKKLLVTGTDTDVGKTWISQLILKQMRDQKHRIGAYKPACSGAIVETNGSLSWSDVDLLSSAIEANDKQLICPQTFQAALAPNVAAELEGRVVSDELLVSGASAWEAVADYLLIEGAGGLCCPLSNSISVADLAEQLSTPIVIVAANRLGVINHTLLTVEVAKVRGLQISAVILNDCKSDIANDDSPSSNLSQLRRLLPDVSIHTCAFGAQQLEGSSNLRLDQLFG